MKNKIISKEIAGRTVSAHITDLAFQANGSLMLSCDGTVVLAAVTQGSDSHKNPGYFNLTVEYVERFYATGKIGGGQYQRREARPSLQATLASRVIDRTCRPLFNQKDKNSVQIIVTVLSVGEFDPVVLGCNAVSTALHISDIVWNGPIGCAKVGIENIKDNSNNVKLLDNPYFIKDTIGESLSADLLICGDGSTVNMIEMGANEVSDETFDIMLDRAIEITSDWVSFIKDIRQHVGKEKRAKTEELDTTVLENLYKTTDFESYIEQTIFGDNSKQRIGEIHAKWEETVNNAKETDENEYETNPYSNAEDFLDHKIDEILHKSAIKDKKRADGRKLDEVRQLYAQAGGISDRLHGTGVFYRGETHVLTVATLAGPDKNLNIDSMETTGEQRFFHHYNFPPYSVGETGRVGFTGRRELGHGALAEKALQAVIPSIEEFPYTIRLVSECVSSNGSTSQASVCGSTLALMDAGVPIIRPVAGISIGLMMDTNEKDLEKAEYVLLTDIQGPEDHHGDMDFKVSGTTEGITAIQLDIKLLGVTAKICKEAVRAARKAHTVILETITSAIPEPRKELSPYAPRIEIMNIDPEYIGLVIGGGGKTIQKIQKDTNTNISIEDSGQIVITSADATAGSSDGPIMSLTEAVAKARKIIEDLTREWQVGDKVTGEIVKIIDETGAIVEWAGGKSGMIHISEISKERVSRVSDKLSEGQIVDAIIISVDKERDRIGLSIKKLKDTPDEY